MSAGILAFAVAAAAGCSGAAIFGGILNGSDEDAVFALVTLGAFILNALRKRRKNGTFCLVFGEKDRLFEAVFSYYIGRFYEKAECCHFLMERMGS